MWPIRMDMTRDECRKCLRCLELDAYGNMVSVLRAQGQFTDDKKRLLAELAKVLHISNERHRAEVRRAVNDEKLSVIAEQLNGPNTWADWAIEGRRTIPLLPRLKAHTAFTGLANSLSLVLAAANEKKAPTVEHKTSINEKHQEPIVKAETEISNKIVVEKEKPSKSPIVHTQINTRGKKRKRSLEVCEASKIAKLHANEKTNTNSVGDSTNCQGQNSLSSQPISSQDDEGRCLNETLTSNPIIRIVSPAATNCSDSTNSITDRKESIPQDNNTAIEHNSSIQVDGGVEQCLDNELIQLEATKRARINDINTLISDNSETHDVNLINLKNAPSPTLIDEEKNKITSFIGDKKIEDSTEKLYDNISSEETGTNGLDSSELSPLVPQSPKHNNLQVEKISNECKIMELELNSEEIVNKNIQPNDKLESNIHVIVQSETELFDSTEEVLIKVMENADDQSAPTTVTSLIASPIYQTVSNHGEEGADAIIDNSDHLEIAKLNSKLDEMIVLDIQQDDSVETNSPLIVFRDSNGLNSHMKTVLTNLDAHSFVEEESAALLSSPAHHVDIILEENNVTDEESADREINANVGIIFESPSKVIEEAVCEEIILASEHEIIGAQTEIFNFETTDDQVCEIQMENTTNVDILSACSESIEMNMDNMNSVENHEETICLQEDDIMRINAKEQLNKFS